MRQVFSTPWLRSAGFDLSFILLPSVLSVGAVFLFSESLDRTQNLPLWAWLVFILGIDVSHVYSTLFRTYFNSNEFNENKILLTMIPMALWLVGILLYSIHSLLFWRVLAYVAVFHFIRQQYGFMRLYTRGEPENRKDRWLASSAIYLATIHPMIHWHCHQPRNFHWFIDGDFLVGLPVVFSEISGFLHLAVLSLYFVNEVWNLIHKRQINLPKNAIVIGTALSWYFGIVHFNGDMAFTMTNVISHGIPYLALVWAYGERQKKKEVSPLIFGRLSYGLFFSKASLPLFLGILLFFGYLEEGLWAGFVWREHLGAFGFFNELPKIEARDTLSWLVPLLTLPQATHYVLDGFIWKMKDSQANWQTVLFAERTGR